MRGTVMLSAIRHTLAWMADDVAAVNEANGWYDDSRTVGDDIALLHSEVSEMLEAYRDHGFSDPTEPHDPERTFADGEPAPLSKPEGFGSEAADVLIRLLDTCHRHNIDLGAEYVRKLAYNRTREHRHGGKLL